MAWGLWAMPPFVVLEHCYPDLPWDFMLESGDVLRTWRLLAFPRSNQPVPAIAIGDHRLLYLEYEGPLSDNRGGVTRCDGGEFQWVTPPGDTEADQLIVVLGGKLL